MSARSMLQSFLALYGFGDRAPTRRRAQPIMIQQPPRLMR